MQLQDLGYCVIPNVFSPSDCDSIHNTFWDSMTTASGGSLKVLRLISFPLLHFLISSQRPNGPDDLRDFKFTEHWPQNKRGIFEDGGFAHLPLVYQVRTHPRVALVFAMLYGTSKRLVVAADRLNYQLPLEWLPRQRDLATPSGVDEKGNTTWTVNEVRSFGTFPSPYNDFHRQSGCMSINPSTRRDFIAFKV